MFSRVPQFIDWSGPRENARYLRVHGGIKA